VVADPSKFEIGSPVNVTQIGYPYYAAIVVECDENYVTVKFPKSTNVKHHKYPIKNVQTFKPQLNGTQLMPIKYTVKTLTRAQKKNIRLFEENVLEDIKLND